MASQPKHHVSVQEYLRQEESARERHEYLNGEIFVMAGGTPDHALIAPNIIAAIRPQLQKSGCRIRNSDMRLRTSPTGLYSYADAVISCEPELFDGTTLLNPVVVIEVLSESTEDYDRGKKFELYRQIPSFREYLVVAQDRTYVEHHVREESSGRPAWIMRQFTGLNERVLLSAVTVSLPLTAIYADVEFRSETTTSIPAPLPQ